jgi:hypothetical protein
MNCQLVQSSLSLYLYGELDFAREEELENHLAECAFCQIALAREKQWHTLSNSQVQEPPLDLLAECRQQLRPALAREKAHPPARPSWWRFTNPFQISATRWSAQIALASMLLFTGFAAARLLDRYGVRSNANQMGLLSPALNPARANIRDIQGDGSGSVRIVVNQESEVIGHIDDPNIRALLLAGTRQSDPGVRFYSFQFLTEPDEAKVAPRLDNDVRDVVSYTVRNDPNPAVRLAALEGLRPFAADPAVLETLKFVLEQDGNPGVRSLAIDILAPVDQTSFITPAQFQAMQDIVHSSMDDDYVRARCTQLLRRAKLPVIY